VAGNVREAAVQVGEVAPRVAAEQSGGTRVGAQEPQEYPDGGGFTGAVRAEEAVHLAGADGQIETVQQGRSDGLTVVLDLPQPRLGERRQIDLPGPVRCRHGLRQ
ncbi:MAG: hypothetical protein JWP76_4251, partial [Dactylosporangium sp.]|nr:hypothetical protein [Dactylosporangium sp.]